MPLVSEQTPKAQKKTEPKPPSAWKNTFFWFAALLVILALIGLVSGPEAIRDPGQVRESGLVWIYLGGALVMAVNGYLTHQQALKAYRDEN